MSVFKLPDSLCDELAGMVRRFWWGQKEGKNKMAWLSWDKMCAPKEEGGLGFRDLKAFNLALLAKQGWRLQMNSNSLVHRVLKARYFPNTDFLHAELGTKPSFAWRSILAAQTVVQSGYHWQVGNGKSIGVWMDRWLPRPSTFRVLTPPTLLPVNTTMDSLMDQESGEWNLNLINWVFFHEDATSILSIPLSRHKPKDRMIWAFTPRGRFIVNSAYKVSRTITQLPTSAKTISEQ